MKAVVFDLDGVIRIGNKLVESANKTLRYLVDKGIKTMIVTNECRYTVDYLKDELEEIGLQIPEETLFYTAALSCKEYLEKKIKRFPKDKIKVGIVGELGLYKTINQLNGYDNMEIVNDIDDIEVDNNMKLYLVVGSVNRIKINNLDKILKWLKKDARVIVTCPDTTDPSSKGDFNLGMPNHLLYMAGYNKLAKKYNTGKPNPIVKEIIMRELGIDNPGDVLFVGDTLYTDIQLAEESGFKSCLVLTGNSNRETLKNFVVEPDYVLKNVGELQTIFNY